MCLAFELTVAKSAIVPLAGAGSAVSSSESRHAPCTDTRFMAVNVSSRVKAPSKAPLSLIALQIVRASLPPEASLPALAKLAESDPGFAMRIIAMVNSASFGPQRHVSDVRQA